MVFDDVKEWIPKPGHETGETLRNDNFVKENSEADIPASMVSQVVTALQKVREEADERKGVDLNKVLSAALTAAGFADVRIAKRKKAFTRSNEEDKRPKCNISKPQPPRKGPTESARCRFEGCTKYASFGFPGERKLRCLQHIVEGMIDVKHVKRYLKNCKSERCQAEGCEKFPSFGWPNSPRVRCGTHMLLGMVDRKHGNRQHKTSRRKGVRNDDRPVVCKTSVLPPVMREKALVVGGSGFEISVPDDRLQQEQVHQAEHLVAGPSPLMDIENHQNYSNPQFGQISNNDLSHQLLPTPLFATSSLTPLFSSYDSSVHHHLDLKAANEGSAVTSEGIVDSALPSVFEDELEMDSQAMVRMHLEKELDEHQKLQFHHDFMHGGVQSGEELNVGSMEEETAHMDASGGVSVIPWNLDQTIPSSPGLSYEQQQQTFDHDQQKYVIPSEESSITAELEEEHLRTQCLVNQISLFEEARMHDLEEPAMLSNSSFIQHRGSHQQSPHNNNDNNEACQPFSEQQGVHQVNHNDSVLQQIQSDLKELTAQQLGSLVNEFTLPSRNGSGQNTNRACVHLGCTRMGQLNFPGQSWYCEEHREKGMDLLTCSEEGCQNRPYYAQPLDHAPTRCKKHKEEGMVDRRGTHPSHRCSALNCVTIANFNYPGGPGRWCANHKFEGMVNVKEKRQCAVEGCAVRPYFGYPDNDRASRCSFHKEVGMMDIRNGKCEAEGCQKLPGYGFPWTPGLRPRTKGNPPRMTRCSQHKLEGMVGLKNPLCEAIDCSKQAVFGSVGGRACRCTRHQVEGMVKTGAPPVCNARDCRKVAKWGFENEGRATRCKYHKVMGMVAWNWAVKTRIPVNQTDPGSSLETATLGSLSSELSGKSGGHEGNLSQSTVSGTGSDPLLTKGSNKHPVCQLANSSVPSSHQVCVLGVPQETQSSSQLLSRDASSQFGLKLRMGFSTEACYSFVHCEPPPRILPMSSSLLNLEFPGDLPEESFLLENPSDMNMSVSNNFARERNEGVTPTGIKWI